MPKLYAFVLLLFCISARAQYVVNGSAAPDAVNPNEFVLTPAGFSQNLKGSVFHNTPFQLSQNFVVHAELYFGNNDVEGGDGIAFVLQNEGTGYLGNSGAGIGYHRFNGSHPSDIGPDFPGPVPSFIIEFDTYQNGFIGNQDIADPADDHIGFMTHSQAYHSNTITTLMPPVPTANVETGSWHPAKFSWNATTETFTLEFAGSVHLLHLNLDSIVAGNSAYWGFTASFGHAITQQSVRILNVVTGTPVPPLTITGVVSHAACNGGGDIDITVTGGTGNYSFSWSNGATTEDISNLQPGIYTVTVTDGAGTTQSASFTVGSGPDQTPPELTCPGEQRLCQNLFSYYNIPQLVAADNCGIQSIHYNISGATTRNGTGKNASGFFNPGNSIIVWTVKDGSGNLSKCTTRVIISKVEVNIPDVYAVNPGGNANTIYKGYGPSSLTLTAQASGGTPPYEYMWTNGATTPSITVSPSQTGTHLYGVLVKDARGCYGIMIKTVKVVDIRCGNNKVEICHVTGSGNKRKKNELCVSTNAVAAHLAHGDQLGECRNDNDRNDRDDRRQQENQVTEHTLASEALYPNPTTGKFQLRLNVQQTGSGQVLILNSGGRVVERRTIQLTGSGQLIDLDLSKQSAGIYLVRIVTPEGEQTEKIVVQR